MVWNLTVAKDIWFQKIAKLATQQNFIVNLEVWKKLIRLSFLMRILAGKNHITFSLKC